MIRLLDLLFSVIGIILLFPVFILVLVLGYFDTGSPLFIQTRVGKNKKPFRLVKFRTMNVDTKSVASHMADRNSITKFGEFLRKTKLDELPQLINVMKGEMSLVGPRPNLFNQVELIAVREQYKVYDVVPGITGLSQVNNIDMSTPKLLAETDSVMIKNTSILNYFKLIAMTVLGSGSGDAIR
ncbi:sugar transferase [Vibrio coralliilyticus]|uniref:Lipid carrier: UDP-N-acetylgalactosaminyltransferase n=1 Tax=Vibrio coralliilyticus TaxID=190893 RepID=A0AAN0SD80_9VIBR|nr:sugar transferase [Vibrio coralliilyticus]AIW20304.1 lipid carrier : UDP-N-acetylgalactosaminyltransferase [Vibrio coralliilyticus]NOH38568.1 sugar transferase [Vibrio coralliilyticus]